MLQLKDSKKHNKHSSRKMRPMYKLAMEDSVMKIARWSFFREASNLPKPRQAPDVKKEHRSICDANFLGGILWASEVVKAKDTKTEGEPLVASGLHLPHKKPRKHNPQNQQFSWGDLRH